MAALMQENWILVAIALVVALLVTWWLFVASRRTRVTLTRSDEDPGPARRNQALIDAPPAAQVTTIPPVMSEAVGGVGEAIEAAVHAAQERSVPEDADDLTRIKGLGPKLAEQLRGLGVTRFSQIAAWDEAEVDRIDAQLGRFQGRIRRDDWRGQAALLAADDTAGYEAKFGKL